MKVEHRTATVLGYLRSDARDEDAQYVMSMSTIPRIQRDLLLIRSIFEGKLDFLSIAHDLNPPSEDPGSFHPSTGVVERFVGREFIASAAISELLRQLLELSLTQIM